MAEETGRNSDSLPLCRELLKISLDSMTILQSSGVLRRGRGEREKGKVRSEERGHLKFQRQSGPAAGFRVPGMETR